MSTVCGQNKADWTSPVSKLLLSYSQNYFRLNTSFNVILQPFFCFPSASYSKKLLRFEIKADNRHCKLNKHMSFINPVAWMLKYKISVHLNVRHSWASNYSDGHELTTNTCINYHNCKNYCHLKHCRNLVRRTGWTISLVSFLVIKYMVKLLIFIFMSNEKISKNQPFVY